MKKKFLILVLAILMIAGAIIVWYVTPVALPELNADKVNMVHIFSGNTGEELTVADRDDIEFIVKELNNVKLKRKGISAGRMGYMYRINVYESEDGKTGVWSEFIINSPETFRNDPFFYKPMTECLVFDYIDELYKENTSFPRAVRIDNEIYYDTGKESNITARCGVMDGTIISAVPEGKKPINNNESNFGERFEYQYVDENSIDVVMDGQWIRFEKELHLDLEKSYVYANENNPMKKASVNLYKNGRANFCYSMLSSYFGMGTYEVAEDRLIINTDDGANVYVFEVKGNSIFFHEKESSELPAYSYESGAAPQKTVPDGAEFKLTELEK